MMVNKTKFKGNRVLSHDLHFTEIKYHLNMPHIDIVQGFVFTMR